MEGSRQKGGIAPRSRKIPNLQTRTAVVSGVADGNTTFDQVTAAGQTPLAAQPLRTVRLAFTEQADSVAQSTRQKEYIHTDQATSTSADASIHQAAATEQPALVQEPASIRPTARGGKILRGNTDQRAGQGDISGEAATSGINSGRVDHDDQVSTSVMARGQSSTSQTTAIRKAQPNPAPPPKPSLKKTSKGDSTPEPTPAEGGRGGSGRVTAGPSSASIPVTSTPKGSKLLRNGDTSQSRRWTPLDGYDMCKVHTEKRLYLAVSTYGHAMSEGRWCLGDGSIIQWTPPVSRGF